MSLLRSLLVLGVAVSAWACGSDADLGGSEGSGAAAGSGGTGADSSTASSMSSGGGDGGSAGAATGAGGTGGLGPVDCSEAGGDWVFPTFDKSCSAAGDCMIAFHMISCCGTRAAIGINTSGAAAFEAAEAECEAEAPGCGCAQGPTEAEDGQSTVDESSIVVTCSPDGGCLTSVN